MIFQPVSKSELTFGCDNEEIIHTIDYNRNSHALDGATAGAGGAGIITTVCCGGDAATATG